MISTGRVLVCASLFVFASASGAPVQTETADTTIKSETAVHLPPTSLINLRAAKSQSLLRVAPATYSHKREYSDDGRNLAVESTESYLMLGFERGLSDQTSLGLSTTYGQERTKRSSRTYDNRFEGFSDPTIEFRFSPAGQQNLFFRVDLSLSPGVSVASTRDVPGNRLSGGQSIMPSISYEGRAASHLVAGSYLNYRIRGAATEETRTIRGEVLETTERTGGNILHLGGFGEFQKGDTRIGLDANMSFEESMTENYSNDESSNFDPRTFMRLTGYGNIPVANNFDFGPELTYSTLLSRSVNNLDYGQYNSLNVQLLMRMSL